MFEGRSIKDLKKAFHEAVDDYLETWKKMGVSLNPLVQKALEEKGTA
jgi:predicted HicB family RNase H-like nuclease